MSTTQTPTTETSAENHSTIRGRVPRIVGPDCGPACPSLEKKWRSKGCELGLAAKIIAENDDVRCLLEDDDAMPVSVALLGMIYGLNDAQARSAVIHWLRRPNAEAEARRQKTTEQ